MIKYLAILLLLASVVFGTDDDIGYDTASSAASNATTDATSTTITYCAVTTCGKTGTIDSIQVYTDAYTATANYLLWVYTKANAGSWVFKDSVYFDVTTGGGKIWRGGAAGVGASLAGEDSIRICAQAWSAGGNTITSANKNTSYSGRYDWASGQSKTAETDISGISFNRSGNDHLYAMRVWYHTAEAGGTSQVIMVE